MRHFAWLLLVALVVRPVASAAPDSPLRLTLGDAVARGIKHSARLTELDAMSRVADAAVSLSESQRRPTLDLTAGYRRLSNVPELTLFTPGVGERTIFPNIPDNYRSRLELRVPVYTSGRLERGIDAAIHDQMAVRRDAEMGTQMIAYEVQVAFWRLVLARESERVLRTAILSFEGHLKAARDRAAVGMAAINEVLSVELERDRAELAQIRANGDVATLTADMQRLLDLDPEVVIEPTEPISPIRCEEVPVDVLLAEGLDQRHDRQGLIERVAAASDRVVAQSAGRRPQAFVLSGYDVARPNTRILPPEATVKTSWDVGVTVQLTVFDGGRTEAAVAQAAALKSAVEARLEHLDRTIAVEIRQRRIELTTANAAIPVADRALRSAAENLRVARDRYEEGVLTSAELLDAETAEVQASLEGSMAAIRAQLACAALQRALGR